MFDDLAFCSMAAAAVREVQQAGLTTRVSRKEQEMSKRNILSAGLMIAAGLAAASSQPAAAGYGALAPPMNALDAGALLQLADVRSYRHCHNMPRRTRCHFSQRLPVNWPPNTNTSNRSSLRERQADRAGRCADGRRGWFCWR